MTNDTQHWCWLELGIHEESRIPLYRCSRFFFKRFKWNTHGLQNQNYVMNNEFCTLKRTRQDTLSEIQYERRKTKPVTM